MIPVPSGVRVWLATGATDMRRYAERRIMRSPQPLARLLYNIINILNRIPPNRPLRII